MAGFRIDKVLVSYKYKSLKDSAKQSVISLGFSF